MVSGDRRVGFVAVRSDSETLDALTSTLAV